MLEGWKGWKAGGFQSRRAGRLGGWRAGKAKAGGLGGWRLRGWSLENSRRNVFQVLVPVVFFPGFLNWAAQRQCPRR